MFYNWSLISRSMVGKFLHPNTVPGAQCTWYSLFIWRKVFIWVKVSLYMGIKNSNTIYVKILTLLSWWLHTDEIQDIEWHDIYTSTNIFLTDFFFLYFLIIISWLINLEIEAQISLVISYLLYWDLGYWMISLRNYLDRLRTPKAWFLFLLPAQWLLLTYLAI